MSTRIVNTAKRATRILNTSSSARRLDGAVVTNALGGRAIGYKLDNDTSPITLFQVRGELSRLLASDGGRPSLAGARDKVKIPRFSKDWIKIEALARAAGEGMAFRPSPAQVAAVLLHAALEHFSDEEAREVVRHRIVA